MSVTTAGPFALHPADPGAVEDAGGRLSRFGSRAESVGSQADRLGWLAGAVESQGLFDPIRSTVQPVLDSGVMLASAGRVADLALKVWSRAVRDYNRTIDRLNTDWETAKAGNFGVGELVVDRASMSPKAVTDAAQEHAADLADAKDALWAELRRRQHAAEERLDAIADGVAAMLGNADDPDIQLLAASMLFDAGTGTADSNDDAEYQSYNPYGSYGSVIEGAGDPSTPSWSDLGEMLAFVFGDPRACVGDDASAGACGLEVAGLIPIFKGPKWAAKIAKYFKRADQAKDHARDAKRAEWPKKRYDDLDSRGSTGRKKPSNLREEIAMGEVRENPELGLTLRTPMKDPRWPGSAGWVKMVNRVSGIEIHYVMNTRTGVVDDFKFKY